MTLVTYQGRKVNLILSPEQLEMLETPQQPKDITERVTTFEQACGVLGKSVSDVLSNFDTVDEVAYKKLKIIIEALNEGWVPDFTDRNQYKWRPVFEANSSGFGFSYSDSYYVNTLTFVGARLLLKSESLSDFCAKTFPDEWNAYLSY